MWIQIFVNAAGSAGVSQLNRMGSLAWLVSQLVAWYCILHTKHNWGRSPLLWNGPKTASAVTGPGFAPHQTSPRAQLPGPPIFRAAFPDPKILAGFVTGPGFGSHHRNPGQSCDSPTSDVTLSRTPKSGPVTTPSGCCAAPPAPPGMFAGRPIFRTGFPDKKFGSEQLRGG